MRAMLSLLFLLTDYEQLAGLLRWGLDCGLALFGVTCAAAVVRAICIWPRRPPAVDPPLRC